MTHADAENIEGLMLFSLFFQMMATLVICWALERVEKAG